MKIRNILYLLLKKIKNMLNIFSFKASSSIYFFFFVTGIAFSKLKLFINILCVWDYYKLIRLFGYLRKNV